MEERALRIYAHSRGRKKLEVYIGDEDGYFLKATEKILGIGDYSNKVKKYRSKYGDGDSDREKYEIGRSMEIMYDIVKYIGKDLPELVETAKDIQRKTASMLREQKLKQSKIPWPYIFSVGTGLGAASVAQYFGADMYLGLIVFLSGVELVQYAFRRRKHRQMVNELKKILEEENIPLEVHKFRGNCYVPYDHEILLKLKSKKGKRK